MATIRSDCLGESDGGVQTLLRVDNYIFTLSCVFWREQSQLLELLQSEKGMLGVIVSCLGEDYYVDTRRVTCHVMQHLIRVAGVAMEGTVTVAAELPQVLDRRS